jgi:hypothetical protein
MLIMSIAAAIIIIGLIVTWIYALVDMLKRKDLKTWHRVAWMAAIIIFPILGLLVYVLARPPAGEVYYKGETVE